MAGNLDLSLQTMFSLQQLLPRTNCNKATSAAKSANVTPAVLVLMEIPGCLHLFKYGQLTKCCAKRPRCKKHRCTYTIVFQYGRLLTKLRHITTNTYCNILPGTKLLRTHALISICPSKLRQNKYSNGLLTLMWAMLGGGQCAANRCCPPNNAN